MSLVGVPLGCVMHVYLIIYIPELLLMSEGTDFCFNMGLADLGGATGGCGLVSVVLELGL